MALGDVWVVGSDSVNMLYGGSGYIELEVEKLPSGDLKIYDLPYINMTVEDMFDFNYWNGFAPNAAGSIQCAHGRPTVPVGVGDVALLRFDVQKDVENIGTVIIERP